MARRNPDETPDDVVDAALDVLNKDLPDTDPGDPEYGDAVDGDLIDGDGPEDTPRRAVPDELRFTTAGRRDDADAEPVEVLEIDLDGVMLYAAKPTAGAWTMVLSTVSKAATQADKAHALLQFVFAAFDEASQMWLQNRLFDPGDEFDVNTLADIVNALIEKWAPAQSRQQRRDALIAARRNGSGPGSRRARARR